MNTVKKITQSIDYKILIATGILVVLGLIALYSATAHATTEQLKGNFLRQIWWVFIGIIMLLIILFTPNRIFRQVSYGYYAISVVLLILVLFIGKGRGSSRWIALGAFRFQPAEFAKIAVLMALARFLSPQDSIKINQWRQIVISFAIGLIPVALVVQQPDLGTSLVFVAILLPILYWAGLSPFTIFAIVAPIFCLIAAFHLVAFFLTMAAVVTILIFSGRRVIEIIAHFILNVSVGILTPFLWNNLHNYQQKRILTFLGLEVDPRGIGYQLIQSKVAIGSGGLWGKGFFKGTQTQLRFLPAQHTDFIISVIGEEIGFIGIAIVLGLFIFIFLKGIRNAASVHDKYTSILSVGSICVLAFHVIVNIGMSVGIMPITGLPLPFLSYGGSFLITSFILLGFILNASLQKP
ncbi:rod shape-determining protein RodA [candidate division KSB1 bacterium]|nr:rod shape-determining protein RodA [candidate division KSB1 bacterium]